MISTRTARLSPPVVVLAATAVTVLVVLTEAPTWLRAPIVLLWALVAPGWTWARQVGVADRGDELVLSVVVSAVALVLIAGTMAIVGAWSPGWAFALLVALAIAGLVVPHRSPTAVDGTA